MAPHVSIVIIDSDSSSRKTIESLLIKHHADRVKLVGSVSDISEGLTLIRKTNPMVVIMEIKDLEQGLSDIRAILSDFPRVSILATSSDKSSDAILKVMRAGAVEYLLRPIDTIELELALQKIGRLWVSEPMKSVRKGTVISFYNPVGGMGVTTLAVNLAVGLSRQNVKSALVDLNLNGGDISTFLDISPTYTLSTVTSNVMRLDDSFIYSVMTKHSSGAYVLAEPKEVREALAITPDEVQRVVVFLKGMFSYVLMDMGGSLDDRTMAAFESSDQIFFTLVPSLTSIKNARRYLAAMRERGFPKEKIKLILNRYLSKGDIKAGDVEKVLGHQVSATLTNDYTSAIAAINKGEPIMKAFPHSQLSKDIEKFAAQIKTQFGAGK